VTAPGQIRERVGLRRRGERGEVPTVAGAGLLGRDWEYVGRGPVGLEAGLLVTTSLLFGDAAACR
jgi:hypothetical protein